MRTLYTHFLLLTLCMVALQKSSWAQVGFKLSYASPLQEFGAEFKKAPVYDLYYFINYKKDKPRLAWARVGILYASFKPRQDTIPTYMIRGGSPDYLFPGYISYRKFTMLAFYIDQTFRAVHYKGFSVDLGVGLMGGITHQEYSYGYATIISSNNNSIDEDFIGLRTRLGIAYTLTKRIELFAEGMNSLITSMDWSAQFHNNSLGIGCNITFNPRTF